jgi:hypothetical protein
LSIFFFATRINQDIILKVFNLHFEQFTKTFNLVLALALIFFQLQPLHLFFFFIFATRTQSFNFLISFCTYSQSGTCGLLRCQAQLELTFMMCFSDRSTLTGMRATDLHHCFFWRTCCRLWAWVFARAQALSPPIFSWY